MPRILVSYSEIWWIDSEGDHHEIENGWVDEEGMEVEADPLNEMTTVDVTVRMLQDMGTTCPSSTSFHTGIWYHWHDAQQDFETGRYREESAHLKGFSPEQEREIWDRLTAGKIGYFRD